MCHLTLTTSGPGRACTPSTRWVAAQEARAGRKAELAEVVNLTLTLDLSRAAGLLCKVSSEESYLEAKTRDDARDGHHGDRVRQP